MFSILHGAPTDGVKEVVKLQVLISGAAEFVLHVSKCIIKERVSSTTGGQQHSSNRTRRGTVIGATSSCLYEISISDVTDCSAAMSSTMM